METRGKKTVSAEQAELLRQIPSVDELLTQPRLAGLSKRTDRNLVVEVARAVLADLRARIAGDSNWTALGLSAASVEELISTEVERILSTSVLISSSTDAALRPSAVQFESPAIRARKSASTARATSTTRLRSVRLDSPASRG